MKVKLTVVGLYSSGIGKTVIYGTVTFDEENKVVEIISDDGSVHRLEEYETVEIIEKGFVLKGSDNVTTDIMGGSFKDTWYNVQETFWKIELVSL